MKLVIDIPEKIYELCQRDACRWPIRNGRTLYRTVWEAIAKGKPADNDCVSREVVIEWLKDQDFIKMKWQEENARKELAKLSSVIPESED